MKHLLHYQIHNKCYINLPLKKKVKSILSLFPPCLPSVLSSSFVSGTWQYFPAGLLASSLASLQSNLQNSVKGSELYKINIAYSFILLKNILWLSKQMNLMNFLPASPASYPVFLSLMAHVARLHIYIQFLERIILFFYPMENIINKWFFKKTTDWELCMLNTSFYFTTLFLVCYSSSWHPWKQMLFSCYLLFFHL